MVPNIGPTLARSSRLELSIHRRPGSTTHRRRRSGSRRSASANAPSMTCWGECTRLAHTRLFVGRGRGAALSNQRPTYSAIASPRSPCTETGRKRAPSAGVRAHAARRLVTTNAHAGQ